MALKHARWRAIRPRELIAFGQEGAPHALNYVGVHHAEVFRQIDDETIVLFLMSEATVAATI